MAEDDDRRSRGSKKKGGLVEAPEPKKGLPTTDEEGEKLAKWLAGLWRGNESPEHIDVVQFWRNGQAFGAVIDSEPFPSGDPLGYEQAVELANRFIGAAQDDCDKVVRRRLSYGIIAYAKRRGSKEYARFPLDMAPSRTYFNAKAGRFSDEDEEGEGDPLDAKTQSLKYLGHMISAGQFDKQHYGQVFGDLFMLMKEQIHESRAFSAELMQQNRSLMGQWMEALRAKEEAESRALDREMAREWNKMKILLARDGTRVGRNLLMSVFGGAEEEEGGALPPGADGAKNSGGGLVKTGAVRRSKEQNIVDNFLSDCEEAGLMEKLFGSFEEDGDGSAKLVTPGIFTVQQLAVLVRVQKGIEGPEALDVLLPMSGSPHALDMAKVIEAGAIMPDGIALSLQQLFDLRMSKRAAATAAESPTSAPSSSGKPGPSTNP